ncbi:MAG: hypothetical protein E6J41_03720 [Chloroflexi bacterium]|nr:MAG: hypothetical protein E6J41_03720 [Chloroflexota bacterium]
MRLSLSVPDALWLRVRESYPATPPSHLVQAALDWLVAEAETGYTSGPPAGACDRLRRLSLRLRDEARELYEAGYQTGLELADVLEWWALEPLAVADWRLDALVRSGRSGAVVDELRARLAASDRPAARDLAAELEPGRGDVRRAATFASGLVAALRDCAVDAPVIA